MTFFFVGGASGSGKTAAIKELRPLVHGKIDLYDFDDIGIPEMANTQWRQEATEYWLQKLLGNKKDACLLGQMVLGEILACPSAKHLQKINFCLLDVSDGQRIQRLMNRTPKDATQTMLNWASWLRMHTQTPQWEQHVLKENAWDQLSTSNNG